MEGCVWRIVASAMLWKSKQRVGVVRIMRVNTQTVPVETWDTEPNLKVVQAGAGKTGNNGAKPVSRRPVVPRGERPELKVLTWEARVGCLVNLSRNSR